MGGREQSPAHMAMVRSKRAPFTDAREGRLVSAIKWAFVMSRGEPLTTGDLLRRCYLWEWISREGHQQWQRANVRVLRAGSPSMSGARVVVAALSCGRLVPAC